MPIHKSKQDTTEKNTIFRALCRAPKKSGRKNRGILIVQAIRNC